MLIKTRSSIRLLRKALRCKVPRRTPTGPAARQLLVTSCSNLCRGVHPGRRPHRRPFSRTILVSSPSLPRQKPWAAPICSTLNLTKSSPTRGSASAIMWREVVVLDKVEVPRLEAPKVAARKTAPHKAADQTRRTRSRVRVVRAVQRAATVREASTKRTRTWNSWIKKMITSSSTPAARAETT